MTYLKCCGVKKLFFSNLPKSETHSCKLDWWTIKHPTNLSKLAEGFYGMYDVSPSGCRIFLLTRGLEILGICKAKDLAHFWLGYKGCWDICKWVSTYGQFNWWKSASVLKNVLQEWHAYIRTMVQFHVLGEMFDSSGHSTCTLVYCKVYPVLWYQIASDPAWADINRNCTTFFWHVRDVT